MPKERLYLDTSVINVYRDPRDVFLQQQTREFWGKLGQYEALVSTVVIGEIAAAPPPIQVKLDAEPGAGASPAPAPPEKPPAPR